MLFKYVVCTYLPIFRYTVLGGGVFSPVLYFWYKWLDTRFPGAHTATVVKKVGDFYVTGHCLMTRLNLFLPSTSLFNAGVIVLFW